MTIVQKITKRKSLNKPKNNYIRRKT